MFNTANFSSNLLLSRVSEESDELGSSEMDSSEMGLSSFEISMDFGVRLGGFEGFRREKILWVLGKMIEGLRWVLGFGGEGEARWKEKVVGLVMAETIVFLGRVSFFSFLALFVFFWFVYVSTVFGAQIGEEKWRLC